MTTPYSKRVWLITGSSKGFGRALAKAVLAQGNAAVVTARNTKAVKDIISAYPDTAVAVPLDVNDADQIRSSVKAAHERFGKIDVLVNNAGYGLLSAIEESDPEQYRSLFDANVFGLIELTKAVLPKMRERKSGHIVNISSVGGLVSFPGFGYYNATKYAVEGLSEALAKEAEHLGIKVTLVEPGPFRTNWAGASLQHAARIIDDYASTSGQTRKYTIEEENGKQVGDPNKAALAIIKAVEAEHPPLRLVLGAIALRHVRNKLQEVSKELDAWEAVSINTDFDSQSA